MHDRKKKKHAPLSPEEQHRREEEYKYIGGLYTKLIKENKCYTTSHTALGQSGASNPTSDKEGRNAALGETESLLLLVPEAYSMYNYRRHIILDEIQELVSSPVAEAESEEDHFTHRRDATMEMLKKELKLNTEILKNDFKVYAAFSYRNWVINLWIQLAVEEEERQKKKTQPTAEDGCEDAVPTPNKALESLLHILTKEQQQCQLLLSLDARNFHMWNYRRSVLSRIEKVLCLRLQQAAVGADSASFFLPEEAEEIKFTTKEIKSNFSNYSAWHQRGYTIKKALTRHGFQLQRPSHVEKTEQKGAKKALPDPFARTLYALVVEDLFLFTQSIFCDPNDQASFCYATFSLSMFLTFEEELHRQYAQQRERTATENEEIDALLKESKGDIMDCFVKGVVNVVTEQVELGETASCSLSLFFLLQLLLQLVKAQATATCPEKAAARLARYVDQIYARIVRHSTQPCPGEPAALQATVAWLQQELIRNDPLRRGMYEEITTCV